MHKLAEQNAEHVAYEFIMFLYACNMLMEEEKEEIFKNAMLEVALLHARNLFDFLSNQQIKTDSAKANDYMESNFKFKTDFKYMKENKQRINKKLAHLSYDRLCTDNDWDMVKISEEIITNFNKFMKELPIQSQNWMNKYIQLNKSVCQVVQF